MAGLATATVLVGTIIAILTILVNCRPDGIISIDSRVCALSPDKGPCKALFRRYFYSVKSGKCEKFAYGGCQGNFNNFESLKECEQLCSKHVICNSKAESGLCNAYFPSFFYNSTSSRCEEFVYGGCGGNANRFSSERKCLKKCGS